MTDHIILYDFDSSPCSRRVKITLTEKGLDYSVQTVDLGKMQQKTPEYLRINPNGLVPTLVHNGRTLFESSVINDYLEDQFPAVRLWPETPQGKTAAQGWQNQELAMARVYRPLMYSRVMGPLHRIACSEQEFLTIAAQATDNPAHLAWEKKIWNLKVLSLAEQDACLRYLARFADRVERALEGKRYLVEDRFSVADIAVFPRLEMFPNVGFKLSVHEYPNINRWMQTLSQRHSFQSTESARNQTVKKLQKLGVINSVNRALYQPERASLKDKLITRSIRPVLRRSLKIDEALKAAEPPRLYLMPQDQRQEPGPMPAVSLKQDPQHTPQHNPQHNQSDNSQPIDIYGFNLSPICQRIRLILDKTGLDYHWHDIDMAHREHQSDEYLAINACGELPAMRINQQVMTDSLFIAEYLNGLCPELKLFADNAWDLARIRLWHAFDMGFHKEFGVLFHHELGTAPATAAELEQARQVLQEKFLYMDNALQDKTYLECDRLTYADLVLFTRIAGLEKLNAMDCISEYRNIQTWYERVKPELATVTSGMHQSKNKGKSKKPAQSARKNKTPAC